jgi:hypothetical protein
MGRPLDWASARSTLESLDTESPSRDGRDSIASSSTANETGLGPLRSLVLDSFDSVRLAPTAEHPLFADPLSTPVTSDVHTSDSDNQPTSQNTYQPTDSTIVDTPASYAAPNGYVAPTSPHPPKPETLNLARATRCPTCGRSKIFSVLEDLAT